MIKSIKITCLSLLILFSGCKGCTEEDVLKEVNNGNSDPEKLIVAIHNSEIFLAMTSVFGSTCFPEKLTYNAMVTTEVRTASVVNGNLVADPNTYSDSAPKNYTFTHDQFENDNNTTKLDPIKVPSTGAYFLRISIDPDVCTSCCFGSGSKQCGTDSEWVGGQLKCTRGKPRIVFEQLFLSKDRPLPNVDFHLDPTRFAARSCNCDCPKANCN